MAALKNEIAEAILILIKTLIKWLLIGIIVFAGAWFALYQIGEYYDWYRHGRHADKVDVALFVDTKEECEYGKFLYIITNNSEKIVERVHFYVTVKKTGYSDTINESTDTGSSKILKPGERYTSCFSVSLPKKSTVITWQSAEAVEKNDKGEYRAKINGAWTPVSKAQKNAQGQYRVDAGQPDSQYTQLELSTYDKTVDFAE